MRVRIPPGTLNVICEEVRAGVIDLWGSKCTTNVQAIVDHDKFDNEENPIVIALSDFLSEIEMEGHRVFKSSVIETDGEIMFSVYTSVIEHADGIDGSPTYKPSKKVRTRRYSVCKHCQKFSSSNPDEHEMTCPYRVTLESLRKQTLSPSSKG